MHHKKYKRVNYLLIGLECVILVMTVGLFMLLVLVLI
jgi:hypothetical protein